ncbi:hypothetical protein GCM10009737_04470 [Nocardioides lentus]|uniref:Universal stress protein n=1 Tax=Nocardioides lentus TaxID=338077 RepID=A0ABP5ABA5_9ACTN
MSSPLGPVTVLDGGWSGAAAADHAAHVLAAACGEGVRVASHVLADDTGRRVGLAVDGVAPDVVARHLDLLDGVRVAAAPDVVRAHVSRTSGRLVVFRGVAALVGRRTAAGIVADSEVDAVVGLAGCVVGDDDEVDTDDFVRPTWRAGRCELLVQPGTHGLRPFEVRHQVLCCADH